MRINTNSRSTVVLAVTCQSKIILMRVLCTAVAVFVSVFLTGQQMPESSYMHSETITDSGNTLDQVSSSSQVRVFVLAGQSNMQGQGKIYDGSNGAIGVIIDSFMPSCGDLGAECDFTFDMFDGYGDGWNGWTYDFVQDGNVVATETLPNGEEGSAIVTLEDGVSCDVVVNSAGAYAAEISWTLTDPFDNVVASMDGQEDSFPSPNTLLDVVENDVGDQWSMLQTDGEWTVLDDVFLHFENGGGTLIQDNVTIGQGANPDLIGPELMFAHQLDEYYDDPILIIKAAWGGLSLAEDFRPPSAGGTTGPYYNAMIDMVEDITENLGTEFPDLGLTEFELTGFAWFQGWNDAGSEDFLNEYESNLHHLVNDVRNEFENPNLPIVIASAGQGGYEDHWGWMEDVQDIIAVAQENVACDDILYGGTVGFVNTKEFFMNVLDSPDDAGFHYHNNALTFLNVGKSIGDEMIMAINDMAYCEGFTSVPSEHELAEVISVYPNPTTNNITVDFGEWNGHNPRVKLYDIESKIVLETQSNSTLSIDVSNYAKGVYLLEVLTDGQVHRQRVVVE
jgi:hypothetical protein